MSENTSGAAENQSNSSTPNLDTVKEPSVFFSKQYSVNSLAPAVRKYQNPLVYSKRKIALEYIYTQFYGLVCRIPKAYIAYETKKDKIEYYFNTKKEKGHRDLSDVLGLKDGDNFKASEKEHRAKLAKIKGRGNLLAMAALLL